MKRLKSLQNRLNFLEKYRNKNYEYNHTKFYCLYSKIDREIHNIMNEIKE